METLYDVLDIKNQIESEGFAILDNIFTDAEIVDLLQVIAQVDSSRLSDRQINDLFAMRQFFKEVPASVNIVFNDKLKSIISEIFGDNFFVVKSIYFDKPEASNWFVAYHQDLSIAVDRKLDLQGFSLWTKKQNTFAVQPPIEILQDNFTIRIHLDRTNAENGALKVIPKSHLKGIYRPETIDWSIEVENICPVEKGGIMLMKPLLLHSSSRTKKRCKRRVIHIEFSRSMLPDNLNWAEFIQI
ncbi:Ectoine hydroxylase-related dioxygenase (Phytanoyl-CoA dioxygenase family) [Tumidithrix helvetica PCC 7403]|uniref:phytanoyl-CoA dioxygenase family protein n=1 Tax=Tumidithrix helvetica TaxID=3457545 RepID=UPI003CB86681